MQVDAYPGLEWADNVLDGVDGVQLAVVLLHQRAHAHVTRRLRVLVDKYDSLAGVGSAGAAEWAHVEVGVGGRVHRVVAVVPHIQLLKRVVHGAELRLLAPARMSRTPTWFV